MKKSLMICAAVLLCLGLLLGGILLFGRVTITAQEQTYPVGTEEIIVTWRNGTLRRITFGESFSLQTWDGEAWTDMEMSELPEGTVHGFKLIGYTLMPGGSQKHTYPIESYYDPLRPGRYRIAAYFFFDKDIPITESDHHPFYVEFEIK